MIVNVLFVQLAMPAMVGRTNCVAMGTTRDGALTKMLQGLTAAKCAVRALQGKCGTAAVMALPDTASFALQDLTKFRLLDATRVLLVGMSSGEWHVSLVVQAALHSLARLAAPAALLARTKLMTPLLLANSVKAGPMVLVQAHIKGIMQVLALDMLVVLLTQCAQLLSGRPRQQR